MQVDSISPLPSESHSRKTLHLPRFGRKLRITGLALLGLTGLTGIAAAIEHYITSHVPKMQGESRLVLRLEAPYGSVDLRPGADPLDVATLELPTGEGNAPGFHYQHTVKSGYIGVLHIGVGDEGMLEVPQLAVWKATTHFSLASARVPQSDQGSLFLHQIPIAYSFPPLFSYARPMTAVRATTISADAGIFEQKDNGSPTTTRVKLSKDIPMDFSAELGFGESSLNLSGLPIVNATIETGASRARISSNEPNPQVLGNCTVRAGLGEVIFSGISNLNAKHFTFHGGVGSYHLAFDGKLLQNLDAQVEVGLGLCSLAIPATAGRVQVFCDEGMFNSYSFAGLAERHKGYYTNPGFDLSTSPVLTLHLSAGLGKMSVTYH